MQGYKIAPLKENTRLQAIKRRNALLSNTLSISKKQIEEAVNQAQKTSYQKAEIRKIGSIGSYFKRFLFKLRQGLDVRCERAISSAFYSLQLGYRYFRSYLYWFYKTDSDRCRCGSKETPKHLLFACPIYNTTQLERLRRAQTMQGLLSTQEGRKDTIKYLQQTRIATQGQYRQQVEELGEEGQVKKKKKKKKKKKNKGNVQALQS